MLIASHSSHLTLPYSRGYYDISTPPGSLLQVVSGHVYASSLLSDRELSVHFVRVDSVCLSVYPSTCPCGYVPD